jgi:hypothetical protein
MYTNMTLMTTVHTYRNKLDSRKTKLEAVCSSAQEQLGTPGPPRPQQQLGTPSPQHHHKPTMLKTVEYAQCNSGGSLLKSTARRATQVVPMLGCSAAQVYTSRKPGYELHPKQGDPQVDESKKSSAVVATHSFA